MIAPLPHNEVERLAALRQSRLMDSRPEEEFDDLVRLAAHVCGVPVAAISFIDAQRQWFKSILGVAATEIPRDMALCAHTILQPDLLIVQDARTDPRFQDNPQVTGAPHVCFYAGAPLVTEDGYALGTLCVADMTPRHLTPAQEEGLRLIVRLAASQLNVARRVAERECLVAEKENLLAHRERAEAALAQSHTALAESEERLRRLTDAAFEGVAVSQEGVLVDASPAFAALFGYDCPAQVLGLAAKEMAAPDARARVARKIDDCDEEPYEATMQRRDGTTFRAELRGRMTQLGGRSARITVVRDISAHKAMEEALRASHNTLQRSEARLAEAQRVARIGSWEYDTMTARNTWSEELFRLFEMDPAQGDPSSTALLARCHPDDVSLLKSLSVQAMQDCLPYELDIRILYNNGSVRWAHAIGRGERDEAGRVTRLFGTLMDISVRKQAEERFRVLFEWSSDAHLLLGEGGIIDCNPAAITLLRCLDKAQVLSLHPADLSPEFQPDGRSSREKSVEMDALARERGGHRFEWMHRRMNGEEFPVEVTLTSVTLAERPVLLVVWHDLTERKQAEETLRASHARLSENEARLRLALESGDLGSYDMDQTTLQFLEVSDTYKAQFGLPPDADLCPQTVFEMFHSDDRAHMQEAVEKANAEGSVWQAEHRVVWLDGSIHWVRSHGIPIYDEKGRPVRMIGVTQEITDRKALEAERSRLAEREHAIAAQLQTALQPPLPAYVPRLEVAAYTCPALDEAEVGGDFYDCFALDTELYALVIGDVSGKGLAAAQQLALVRNSLRTALYLYHRPAEVAARLNGIVTSHGLLVGFVTAFLGLYDSATGEITYASCAHEPGLIRRTSGAVERLETTGPPLGMDEDAAYGERTVMLSAGDRLLLYTDGLSESGPNRREMLGTEGMTRLLSEFTDDATVQTQAETLVAEVRSIAGGVFRDDVTILLARRE